jgi:hypothetical protein
MNNTKKLISQKYGRKYIITKNVKPKKCIICGRILRADNNSGLCNKHFNMISH